MNKKPISPPELKNDCFALPAGVSWTPVSEAHTLLQERLSAIAATETVLITESLGRILAKPVVALRSNPPSPNSAVDGYAIRGADFGDGPHIVPCVKGRSAAGQPYSGSVPKGHAVRILTGATMPDGVDTVILQEDVTATEGQIAFHGPLKIGSNAREAGEDVLAGDVILRQSRVVTPADLAVLAASGINEVTAYKPLRVGVLSTGDELVEAGDTATADQIYDANRPMLLAMLHQFGYIPIDLGRAPDDREHIRNTLNEAGTNVDVILTSGGASAGDEDHMSALLSESGGLIQWRMAIKPGRPLALAMWQGVPIFGLPGNPVAAMVCTLVFARPALALLSGQGWFWPEGTMLPASFSKSKKAGRREYLRARVNDGQVEVFQSEGSGRISGLSWADGLVELPDEAAEITPGTQVRYMPFTDFGL